MHPFSDDPTVPLTAPTRGIIKDTLGLPNDGENVVSQSVAAREGNNGHKKHIPFKERLILHTDHPIPNCQALLWGRVGNLATEEIVLLGRTVIPLFDYTLQRKMVPWHVLCFTTEAPVAEMFMKYEVKTTPSAVQLLHLTDIKRDQVQLHWTKPLNDHGSPVQGYKIDILLTQAQTGAEWHCLCPFTKTLHTAFVVQNLQGNTEYLVNVMAVNEVGVGDPYEFQIQTAPVEPSAPSKPWIQEARDGCLCVAWHASTQDGGTPITSYKVQMRKLRGATKSAFSAVFGPSEKDAAWADIGSVGAVMDEVKDQPSVYTVWAGPLDTTQCEYRFRVYAMSSAGMSDASELTDAHYT
jgi:hypothetical protein